VLVSVQLVSPVLDQACPEQAQEEVLALLPLLPRAVSAQTMARKRPTQSSQKA
jgi:hypothetical protein